MLVMLVFPLAFFIWSLFQPSLAGYVFATLVAVLVGYLFFIDWANKPSIEQSEKWSKEEIEILRKYHIAFRVRFASRDFSCLLNAIRVSSFVWVPWLAWNAAWIPAAFLAVNFFLSRSLAIRLDPFYFLRRARDRDEMISSQTLDSAALKRAVQTSHELILLQQVAEKLQG